MVGEEHVGETPQAGVQGEEGACTRGPLAGQTGRVAGPWVGGHRREERRARCMLKGRGAKSSLLVCHCPPFTVPCSLGTGGDT